MAHTVDGIKKFMEQCADCTDCDCTAECTYCRLAQMAHDGIKKFMEGYYGKSGRHLLKEGDTMLRQAIKAFNKRAEKIAR
eukprot:9141573-Pyramimonas_sp.AAC.1